MNDTKSIKKTRTRTLVWPLAILSLILAAALAAALATPSIVENQVNSILKTLITNGAADMQIRSIGLSETNLACSLKDAQGKKIGAIGSLTLKYSVFGLLSKKIKSLEIENADILLNLDPETMSVSLPLYDLVKQKLENNTPSAPNTKNEHGTSLNSKIPFALEKAAVSGNLVVLSGDGEMTFIPYSLTASADTEKGWDVIAYTSTCAFSTNRISANGVFNNTSQTVTADISVKFATSALPRDIRTNVLPRAFRANLELDGKLNFSLKDTILTPESRLSAKMHTAFRTGKFKSASDSIIEISPDDKGGLELKIDKLSAIYDNLPLSIENIDVRTDSKLTLIDGSFNTKAGGSFSTDSHFKITKNSEKAFDFTFTSKSAPEQSLEYASLMFELSDMTFDAEGSFGESGKPPVWAARLAAQNIKGINEAASFEAKSLSGLFSGTGTDAEARIAIGSVTAESAGAIYKTDNMTLDAAFKENKLAATLRSAAGNAVMGKFEAALKDISYEIPLALPAPEKDAPEGYINVAQGLYNGKRIAAFNGKVKFEKNVFSLDSTLTAFANHANIILTAAPFDSQGFKLNAAIDIPKQPLTVTAELEELMPQFKKLRLEGFVEMNANYAFSQDAPHTGSLALKIDGAAFTMPEMKLSGNGINLEFTIPRLAEMASAPERKLSFKNIQFDEIKFSDGDIRFRMESPTSYRLENAVLSWCGGRVRTNSTSFTAGQKEYAATLYCDRLQLSELLRQTGVGKLSGEGRVSGSIPVKFSLEEIAFDDAFLYSTPGETGTIKGELNESAAGGTGSSVELAIAREAMKDFSYSWVKLGLNTDKAAPENLKMTLQLDGKPKNDLYFKYDEKTGIFKPSDIPCRFQGIRLDVNINLKLDKTMKLIDYINTLINRKGK